MGGEGGETTSKGLIAGGDQQQQQAQFLQYGTFQGVASSHPPQHPVQQPHYNPPPPGVGFPQPIPPPGLSPYAYGYQSVPVQGYVVAEGRPVRDRLPCCGLGFGWFLFIAGFFLGAIPWYIGTFFLLFIRIDPREKPGYVACLIGAVLAAVAIMLGLTSGSAHHHHHP